MCNVCFDRTYTAVPIMFKVMVTYNVTSMPVLHFGPRVLRQCSTAAWSTLSVSIDEAYHDDSGR